MDVTHTQVYNLLPISEDEMSEEQRFRTRIQSFLIGHIHVRENGQVLQREWAFDEDSPLEGGAWFARWFGGAKEMAFLPYDSGSFSSYIL